MDDYCNQGKADYSDMQDCALGMHYVRYKWCANEQSMIALGSLIFLLDYSSVYSHSWIQRVFYNGCSRLLKFVRISGVYVHMGIRCSKQLVLTEELLMALWIVNNNTKSVFFIIKLMQYKDTSQQAFLIIYLICVLSFIYFSLDTYRWVSHLKSTQKGVGTLD